MSDYVMTGATADELWPLVRDFHYSRRMPAVALHCFAARKPGGLFGDTGEPVAGCIFGLGANKSWPSDALELQRLVRRDDCDIRLSALVSYGLRWLRGHKSIPFVFSYADTGEGHHGGIYQASGWVYVRRSKGERFFITDEGQKVHRKSAHDRFSTYSDAKIIELNPGWQKHYGSDKELYIFPLRQKWPTIARRYGWEAKPYPKPDYAARPLDAPETIRREAGATPAGRSNTKDAA